MESYVKSEVVWLTSHEEAVATQENQEVEVKQEREDFLEETVNCKRETAYENNIEEEPDHDEDLSSLDSEHMNHPKLYTYKSSTKGEIGEDEKEDADMEYKGKHLEANMLLDGQLHQKLLQEEIIQDIDIKEELQEPIEDEHSEYINSPILDSEDCEEANETLDVDDDTEKDVGLNQCKICSKCFKTPARLKQHKLARTCVKKFQCTICDKKFKTLRYLNEHNLVHSSEKAFECTVCQKRCKRSSDLKKHLKVHTDEKPFQCSLCDKSFKSFSDVQQHKLIHSSERAFQCPVCERRFKRAYAMKKHLKLHTQTKLFQCGVCRRRYKTVLELMNHELTHWNRLKYSCKICEKKFLTPSDLKQHEVIHSDQKALHCTICEKEFMSLNHLHSHELTLMKSHSNKTYGRKKTKPSSTQAT